MKKKKVQYTSETLRYVKMIKYGATLLVIYFFIYNTYFGWNRTPINEAEKVFDAVFSIGLGIIIAWFLYCVLLFIETITRIELHKLNNK